MRKCPKVYWSSKLVLMGGVLLFGGNPGFAEAVDPSLLFFRTYDRPSSVRSFTTRAGSHSEFQTASDLPWFVVSSASTTPTALGLATLSLPSLDKRKFFVETTYQYDNVVTVLQNIIIARAYLVYDYQSPSNFRWASVYVNQVGSIKRVDCELGRFNGTWVVDKTKLGCVPTDSASLYRTLIEVDGSAVKMTVNGVSVDHNLAAGPVTSLVVGAASKGAGRALFVNFKVGLGAAPSTAAGCSIQQTACASFPDHRGTFPDDWDGSKTNEARCLLRAQEYANWCNNPTGTTTTATFTRNDGTTASNSFTRPAAAGCAISQPVCTAYPTYKNTFSDNWESSGTNELRCLARAQEYAKCVQQS